MKMHAKDGPAISLKLEEPGHGMTFAARLADVGLDYAPATKDRSLADKLLGDALNYEKAGDEIIRAPELYIFDTCVRTIWEIEHYQWEDWRRKAAERKASKERPMDKDDHCIECVGRILVRQPSFHPMPAPRDAHSESTQGQQSQDFEVY